MGGSQSTRKVTVDNENAIQVSQEALDRIQAQLNAKQAEESIQQPLPQYVPPPPNNYKRQQDYLAEEAYWSQRIESLKRAHNKISSGMQTEYQKTLKEANELFGTMQGDKQINKLTPCQEEKAKVCLLNFHTETTEPIIIKFGMGMLGMVKKHMGYTISDVHRHEAAGSSVL